MAKKYDKLLDALAWVAFAIVVLYLLLKVLGIFESPLIADLTAVASGAFFVGKYAQKIDTYGEKIDVINKNISSINKRLGVLEKEFVEFRLKRG